MTSFDPQAHLTAAGLDPHQTFDPSNAAQSIGTLLQALVGSGQAGGQTSSDPLSQTPNMPQAQSAVGTTVTPGQSTSSSDSSIVDPVPAGTPVNQGYGVNGHPGIDLGVPLDTQLAAAESGTVTLASNTDPHGYGLEVEIATPDGHHIRYGHLHSVAVAAGQSVKAGQVIGTSGGEAGGANSGNSTGAHLHFEVRDASGNTVDPTPWLAGGHAIVNAAPSQVTVTSPADPEAQLGSGVTNIGDVLAGKPAHDQPDNVTTTTQQPGQTGQQGTGQPGADNDPNAVDSFLAATRKHESGGDYHIYNQSGQSNASGAYQFLGSTWRSEGGTTANAADASPAEQDAVARKMAMALFNQFHSWRLVAIAWYGGPGIAQQVASGQNPGSPQGQGGYLDYGNTIAGMMARGEGA